jgi:preprotein translocase subunit SecF
MVETLSRILKIVVALSLFLLSVLLIGWYIATIQLFSVGMILRGVVIGVLSFLFITYGISLIKHDQAGKKKLSKDIILDEDELKEHSNNEL